MILIEEIESKLELLEKELQEAYCGCRYKQAGGYTIRFDDESGKNIFFMKNMPINQTGILKDTYDKESQHFDQHNQHVKWPYTGFVIGDITGLIPISPKEIANLFEKYGSKFDDFIQEFSKDRKNCP